MTEKYLHFNKTGICEIFSMFTLLNLHFDDKARSLNRRSLLADAVLFDK